MKQALVYFTCFTPQVGGSEYLPLALVRALQAEYAVTLALRDPGVDPRTVAADYGLPLDEARLEIVALGPRTALGRLLDRRLKGVWQGRLRRMGPAYDVCISCANPVDFGRPGIHFVHMLTLDHAFMAHVWRPAARGWTRVRDGLVAVRDAFVRRLAGVRSPRQILRDGRETVIPNSAFARRTIEHWYGCRLHAPFPPPTLFESVAPRPDARPTDIAFLGRVAPEKRVLEAVEIVRSARRRTGADLRLRIAGAVPGDGYGAMVRAAAQAADWVVLEGAVTGAAKARFLAECPLALHTCRVEAFGIAVTEYLKAGSVPVVPRAGAAAEVVGLEDVAYDDADGAAAVLARLVTDAAFRRSCAAACAARAALFAPEAYRARQAALLRELLSVGAAADMI